MSKNTQQHNEELQVRRIKDLSSFLSRIFLREKCINCFNRSILLNYYRLYCSWLPGPKVIKLLFRIGTVSGVWLPEAEKQGCYTHVC